MRRDPAATPALLCAALEVTVNRLLRREPAALDEIAALTGKCLSVTLSEPGWSLWLEPHHGGVRIQPAGDADADVEVEAPTLRILGAARSILGGTGELPAELSVRGDLEVLQQFNRALATAGFDPEELLAATFGDVVGHRLGEAGRRLTEWARSGSAALAYSTADYLREETGDLARADDVAEWMEAVDELCAAVDRSAARVEHLESTRGGTR